MPPMFSSVGRKCQLCVRDAMPEEPLCALCEQALRWGDYERSVAETDAHNEDAMRTADGVRREKLRRVLAFGR